MSGEASIVNVVDFRVCRVAKIETYGRAKLSNVEGSHSCDLGSVHTVAALKVWIAVSESILRTVYALLAMSPLCP